MSKKLVLIVDDDAGIRTTRALLCKHAGFDVITALDGFDAIMKLSSERLPDLIVSDLNMPHMSGFEFLSVVRRRFPLIRVLASSGAYTYGNDIPGGVIADGFLAKAGEQPERFLQCVGELLGMPECTLEERASRSAPPVWIPSNGRDPAGVPFVISPARIACDRFR
jgi:CheY-like chemotaxis protein